MNILNGTKAFEAMSAGQKIECRHVGSDLDFDEIRNFPATVFIDQEYEFRVAVVYMLIGAIRVPEATKEAPAKGTLCFTPSLLTTELSKSFKWKNSDLDLALLQRGQIHLYEENAVIHAQALITISHGSFKADEASTADNELPWEDKNVQNPTSNDVEDKTSRNQLNTEEDPAEQDQAFIQRSSKIKDDFIHMFSTCKTEKDINGVHGMALVNKLLTSSDKALITAYREYLKSLKELLSSVANSSTPAEVNAHIRDTKSWTEIQRKPLLDAIHKRLQELAPVEAEIKMPPSLMVQIQNAPDLTTLDALEIDVSTRHVDIQPKLMGYVKQRRFELENQASEAS
jgi:hypothetical protein